MRDDADRLSAPISGKTLNGDRRQGGSLAVETRLAAWSDVWSCTVDQQRSCPRHLYPPIAVAVAAAHSAHLERVVAQSEYQSVRLLGTWQAGKESHEAYHPTSDAGTLACA